MSIDACEHHTPWSYNLDSGHTVLWCPRCGGFNDTHPAYVGPKWLLPKMSEAPKQAEADGAIHVEDARRALKQIDVLTQDVAALYDVARIDEKRLDALSKQGERHDRMLTTLAEASVIERLDALSKQREDHGKMLASLAEKVSSAEKQLNCIDSDIGILMNSDASAGRRLNAFAEQGEAQGDTIAKLCEDVDMAKADTLRAHKFIDNLCELLSDMQRRTRGLP